LKSITIPFIKIDTPPTLSPANGQAGIKGEGAICDVNALNKHAGLLRGRKNLYPKLGQYLGSFYV
jgi:hypothetical protein